MTDVDVDRQLEIGVSLEPNATSGIQHVYKYTNIYISYMLHYWVIKPIWLKTCFCKFWTLSAHD